MKYVVHDICHSHTAINNDIKNDIEYKGGF